MQLPIKRVLNRIENHIDYVCFQPFQGLVLNTFGWEAVTIHLRTVGAGWRQEAVSAGFQLGYLDNQVATSPKTV